MAVYPDAPSRRMNYDVDGTSVWIRNSSSGFTNAKSAVTYRWTTEATTGQKNELNDSDLAVVWNLSVGSYTNTYQNVLFLFAEDKEIDGLYWYAESNNYRDVAYSLDTTNGHDGTWTDVPVDHGPTTLGAWLNNITSLAYNAVKGMRFFVSSAESSVSDYGGFNTVHLYGTISPGETADRLIYLDTDNADAVFTKPVNYGETPRGSSRDRTFKIKNNSGTLTATTIQITAEDFYDGSGNWYTFGTDGVNFQGTINLVSLAPGAEQLVYIRQSVPSGQNLGPYEARIKAVTTSWS